MTATSNDTATRALRLAEVRRHVEAAGVDVDAEHEIYHRDAVLELPQSGERFEGVDSFRAWRATYPGNVTLRTPEIIGEGDVWVAFTAVSYDGGPWHPAVAVMEFRGDAVAREVIYVAETFEAPAWRARYQAKSRAG
jgi:hypothetical protein